VSTPRKAPPSIRKIVRYWSSEDGEKVLDQLEAAHKIDLDKMRGVKGDSCWACSRPNSKDLERCHIVPHANDGNNEANNFVLMCSDCHAESPTLSDTYYFWEWLSNREHYVFKWVKDITKHLELLPQDFDERAPLSDSLKHVKATLQPVVVRGRYSDSTKRAMIREIIKHQGGQS